MGNLEIINTFILVGLTIAFFLQNNNLKIIKTITDTYQPEKLKQAQEFIEKGNEHRFQLELANKADKIVKDITKESVKGIKDINASIMVGYNELLSFHFSFLKEQNNIEREKYLIHFPKNSEFLKKMLKSYDNGEFDESYGKQK